MNKQEPKLIKNWEELAQCVSDTHYLEIDLHYGRGRIKSKNGSENIIIDENHRTSSLYLSTHTFYETRHRFSTIMLQRCGFNVVLDNWDKER